MKNRDTILLEEAYTKVSEGKYTDNYGRSKFKPQGQPLSPYDDSARLASKREEQTAGEEEESVEDWKARTGGNAPQASSSVGVSAPSAPQTEIDASKFQGKNISYRMNQYDGFEVVIDGKTVGNPDLSSSQAKYIVSLLGDAEKNKNDHTLQNWYKTAIKDI